MIAKVLASLAASAALLPGLSRADDWPQFRGPHQGLTLETGLPLRWSATSNVRWRTSLPGPGHSSPIVWGSRIFVTAFRPEGSRLFGGMKGRLLVLCLEKTTGRVLWEREVPAERIEEVHSTNAPASPTPVTDGTHVYAYFGSYGLVAFDLEGRKLGSGRSGPIPTSGAAPARRSSTVTCCFSTATPTARTSCWPWTRPRGGRSGAPGGTRPGPGPCR